MFEPNLQTYKTEVFILPTRQCYIHVPRQIFSIYAKIMQRGSDLGQELIRLHTRTYFKLLLIHVRKTLLKHSDAIFSDPAVCLIG